ncbi:MAG: hypothetical protein AAGG53_14165 [Cyanobacteria bacterium P01_H01_bin.152]
MPNDKPTPRSDRVSDIKIRQLQQYLHCPGRIPAAPHPFVKQMALKQPISRQPVHPLRNLLAVMMTGFRVMSLLGAPSLVKLLSLLFGRPVERTNREYQRSLLAESSMSVKEDVPHLLIETVVLDRGLDKNE